MIERNVITPANNVKVLLSTCSPMRLKRLPNINITPEIEACIL
jgi:hypothetical protein